MASRVSAVGRMGATMSTAGAVQFLKKATGIASHYGFTPVESVYERHGLMQQSRQPIPLSPYARADFFSRELSPIIHRYSSLSAKSFPEPLLFYHTSIGKPSSATKAAPAARFGLTVTGIGKSIAEALVLKTALAILDEFGSRSHVVHVNSMGDRDSAARFAREAQNFLRKNINDLPVQGRDALRRDVFHTLDLLRRKNHPLAENAPKPMEFLSENSRRHLREVLEFLELEEVPYEIDSTLLGHKDFYSQTLFEVHSARDEADGTFDILAKGGRCDEVARRLLRFNLPTVGIVLEWEHHNESELPVLRTRRPKVYFVQIGREAKVRSLSVLEALRHAHISLLHSLSDESFTVQLERARAADPISIVIMGQREAMDGTVIVRNVATQAQETVSVTLLPTYLKQKGLA
jgi:histidyl-tRNA synthetase